MVAADSGCWLMVVVVVGRGLWTGARFFFFLGSILSLVWLMYGVFGIHFWVAWVCTMIYEYCYSVLSLLEGDFDFGLSIVLNWFMCM